jgi:DNA-binding HxlR family transcriptional regulator
MQLRKLTNARRTEEKRRFDDACGLAHAMELLGERWAMLVLRELAYGPRRFSDLKNDLQGISANVLTQRLTELEARGLVRKTKLPPPAAVQVYEATSWGLEVVPVIASLGKWAARSPLHNPELRMSHVSVVMSLQTLLSAERARGLNARIGFRFGDTNYVTTLHDGVLDAVIHGGAPLETIRIEGDSKLAERFRTLFPLPEKLAIG